MTDKRDVASEIFRYSEDMRRAARRVNDMLLAEYGDFYGASEVVDEEIIYDSLNNTETFSEQVDKYWERLPEWIENADELLEEMEDFVPVSVYRPEYFRELEETMVSAYENLLRVRNDMVRMVIEFYEEHGRDLPENWDIDMEAENGEIIERDGVLIGS